MITTTSTLNNNKPELNVDSRKVDPRLPTGRTFEMQWGFVRTVLPNGCQTELAKAVTTV